MGAPHTTLTKCGVQKGGVPHFSCIILGSTEARNFWRTNYAEQKTGKIFSKIGNKDP